MAKKLTAKQKGTRLFGFVIDDKLHTQMQRVAKAEDRTVSSLIRRAVRAYLSKQEGHRVTT